MSSRNGAAAGLSTEELRALVRAVLRDALPTLVSDASTTSAPRGTDVLLKTDADLDAFIRRIAALCEDPEQRTALQAGRHAFRLAGPPADGRPASSGPSEAAPSVVRIDTGAVTERAVKRAAAAGARIVVGRRAVLTPLARDRARSLGVVIEKER